MALCLCCCMLHICMHFFVLCAFLCLNTAVILFNVYLCLFMFPRIISIWFKQRYSVAAGIWMNPSWLFSICYKKWRRMKWEVHTKQKAISMAHHSAILSSLRIARKTNHSEVNLDLNIQLLVCIPHDSYSSDTCMSIMANETLFILFLH